MQIRSDDNLLGFVVIGCKWLYQLHFSTTDLNQLQLMTIYCDMNAINFDKLQLITTSAVRTNWDYSGIVMIVNLSFMGIMMELHFQFSFSAWKLPAICMTASESITVSTLVDMCGYGGFLGQSCVPHIIGYQPFCTSLVLDWRGLLCTIN